MCILKRLLLDFCCATFNFLPLRFRENSNDDTSTLNQHIEGVEKNREEENGFLLHHNLLSFCDGTKKRLEDLAQDCKNYFQ